MSLKFKLFFRAKMDDGTFRWSYMRGVYSANKDWRSDQEILNIEPQTTFSNGWLIFDVLPPESQFIDSLDGRWDIEGMWVVIHDLVSDKTVGCLAGIYPPEVDMGDLATFTQRHTPASSRQFESSENPTSNSSNPTLDESNDSK